MALREPRLSGGLEAIGRAKNQSISAVVTRADGRVEDLGEIAYWDRNPLRRGWRNFLIWYRRKRSTA